MAYLFVKTGEQKNNVWLNYGIAGHKKFTLSEWVNVNKITEASTKLNWYPSRVKKNQCLTASVETVDMPVSEYEPDSLYDMEASAFMATALKFSSIELIQVMKIVSDNEENHLDDINKKQVQKLFNNNLDPLIKIIDLLQEQKNIFDDIYKEDKLYQDCLEKWHFTEYQKNEVERLIQRWNLLGKADQTVQIEKCKDAKQLILWFKDQLDKASVVF